MKLLGSKNFAGDMSLASEALVGFKGKAPVRVQGANPPEAQCTVQLHSICCTPSLKDTGRYVV